MNLLEPEFELSSDGGKEDELGGTSPSIRCGL